jgi:hypothetical protein
MFSLRIFGESIFFTSTSTSIFSSSSRFPPLFVVVVRTGAIWTWTSFPSFLSFLFLLVRIHILTHHPPHFPPLQTPLSTDITTHNLLHIFPPHTTTAGPSEPSKPHPLRLRAPSRTSHLPIIIVILNSLLNRLLNLLLSRNLTIPQPRLDRKSQRRAQSILFGFFDASDFFRANSSCVLRRL